MGKEPPKRQQEKRFFLLLDEEILSFCDRILTEGIRKSYSSLLFYSAYKELLVIETKKIGKFFVTIRI